MRESMASKLLGKAAELECHGSVCSTALAAGVGILCDVCLAEEHATRSERILFKA